MKKHFYPPVLRPVRAALLVLVLLLVLRPAAVLAQAYGPGLPTVTPPAGTHILNIPNGGRISTFHRGRVFLPQSDANAGCTVWNISNPAAPVKVGQGTGGGNGHIWAKIGDLFWRQYSVNEIPAGANADFLDFSQLPNIAAWTTPMSFPISGGQMYPQTFPLNVNMAGQNRDDRTGQSSPRSTWNNWEA